jgi:hypothetical protein
MGCRGPLDCGIVTSARMVSARSRQTLMQVCAGSADDPNVLIPIFVVFLDLPAPWEAIPHVTKTLRASQPYWYHTGASLIIFYNRPNDRPEYVATAPVSSR